MNKLTILITLLGVLLMGCSPSALNPNPNENPSLVRLSLDEILSDTYIVAGDQELFQSVFKSYQYRKDASNPHQFNLFYMTFIELDNVIKYYVETFNAHVSEVDEGTQLTFNDNNRKITVMIVNFFISLVTVSVESDTSWPTYSLIAQRHPIEFEGEVMVHNVVQGVVDSDMFFESIFFIPNGSIDATMDQFKTQFSTKPGFKLVSEPSMGLQWNEAESIVLIARGLFSELVDEPLQGNEIDQEVMMIVYTNQNED